MSDVTGGTRQIGLPGDVDVPTDPASSMAEPMNEACDETTPRHPADNDFAPLAVSLEQWFESEEKFAELPEDVQKRIACGMGLSIPAALSPEEVQERIKRAEEFEISVTQLPDYVRERNALGQTLSIAAALWNVSSPRRRRSGAQHEDIMNHPGLAAERKALVEKSLQIDEWERTGLNIPIENKTPTDRKLQEEELRKLRNEETVLKAALKRKAQSLGLGWPDDPAAWLAVPPGHVDLADGMERATSTKAIQGAAKSKTIRDQITAAYQYAENNGMKPPNIKEIPRCVQPVLTDMGLSATKQKIMEIAEDGSFKQMRVKVGSRSRFLPFCVESFRKSRTEN